VKTEAAHLGIRWPDLTGIGFTTFADGHVIAIVEPGASPDAYRLFNHLVERGLADPPFGPPAPRVAPSEPSKPA
jgi:hypothetical protein